MPDRWYTSDRIRWCVENFDTVAELAENPRAARHLLRPHRGSSPEDGRPSNRQPWLGGADWPAVHADISSAWHALPEGIEYEVVAHLLFGMSVTTVAESMHKRRQ